MDPQRLEVLSTKRALRVLLAVNILLSGAFLAMNAAAYEPDVSGTLAAGDPEGPVVPSRPHATVLTTQDPGGGILDQARLAAFHPNGSVMYYNNSFDTYFDVDPVANTSTTVLYAASRQVHGDQCAGITICYRNFVIRTNLSTGESTVLYSRILTDRWHDVDRVDDDHVLIGGIGSDTVFLVNHETDIVDWSWSAQAAFDTANGGPYPSDWTHLNDVELLEDGRVMVSLRNQKQVVFLDRETGVVEEWTLGSLDDPSTLNGLHNPDYIPTERGGPSVLVADSLNNRVVEYRRTDGGWDRSWEWTDAEMAWPRDADRLPNGHTLIVDSNGDRIVEVDRSGEVVWSIAVHLPYDVERLETGDESADGQSAHRLGLASQTADDIEQTPAGETRVAGLFEGSDREVAKQYVPSLYYNSALFILPPWASIPEILVALWILILAVGWLATEARWLLRSTGLSFRLPVVFED